MSSNHTPPVVIIAFYKFVTLENFEEMKSSLQSFCDERSLKGTILLAREGINSTISGTEESIDALIAHLRSDARLADLEVKKSFATEQPFNRMKVRLKKEIVTIGIESVDPCQLVGEYVEPKEWNDLISDPDVIVVDTRNEYEVEVGTFEGAINPHTDSFREFPKYVQDTLADKKDKKIAMFCTGGIRCEKSTSYLLQEGFEKVYHLKGGILKYLEEVPPEKSLWRGDCFVFDQRVTVDHALQEGEFEQCFACRRPLSQEDMEDSQYEPGVQCPHCAHEQTPEKRARMEMRQRQLELERQRAHSCSLETEVSK